MSNYTPSTDFASKDSLLSGDPSKVVKGTEFATEFSAIQTAVATKADANSSDAFQAGATTLGATSVTSLTDSGNLTFSGTGNRITGDFSNATIANRVMFQTSTVNGNTGLVAIPNGTATQTTFSIANNSDPTNAGVLQLLSNATEGRLSAAYFGTGTYLPMTFYTGGSERMRIGTDGVISGATFNAINGGQLAGLRNKIINGGFKVDQRNSYAAQTITAGAALAYTADRWYAYSTGANVTGQVVAGASQSQKRYQFTGAASVTAIGFGTRLEAKDTYDLNNKTVTISADLANSLLTTVTWTLYRATTTDDTFGTLASPTVTSIATGTFTVSSTVTRYSTQVSVPSAATTGLQLVFSVGAQTSGTWTIGDVQLEIGSSATPFEQRPYGMELALCQRYYQIVGSTFAGVGSGANNFIGVFTFPAMRVAPTITISSGVQITNGASNFNGSATVSSSTITTTAAQLNIAGFTGLTSTAAYIGTGTVNALLAGEL